MKQSFPKQLNSRNDCNILGKPYTAGPARFDRLFARLIPSALPHWSSPPRPSTEHYIRSPPSCPLSSKSTTTKDRVACLETKQMSQCTVCIYKFHFWSLAASVHYYLKASSTSGRSASAAATLYQTRNNELR